MVPGFTLGICPEEKSDKWAKLYLEKVFIVALMMVGKTQEESKCPAIRDWLNHCAAARQGLAYGHSEH